MPTDDHNIEHDDCLAILLGVLRRDHHTYWMMRIALAGALLGGTGVGITGLVFFENQFVGPAFGAAVGLFGLSPYKEMISLRIRSAPLQATIEQIAALKRAHANAEYVRRICNAIVEIVLKRV